MTRLNLLCSFDFLLILRLRSTCRVHRLHNPAVSVINIRLLVDRGRTRHPRNISCACGVFRRTSHHPDGACPAVNHFKISLLTPANP